MPRGAGAAPQFIPLLAQGQFATSLSQDPREAAPAPPPGSEPLRHLVLIINGAGRDKDALQEGGGMQDGRGGRQVGRERGCGAGMRGMLRGHQPRSFVGLEGSSSQRCSMGLQPPAAHHDVSSLKQIPLAELG